MAIMDLKTTPAGHIIVFSKNDCSQCSATKRVLGKFTEITEINIEENTETYDDLGAQTALDYLINTGAKGMPVIEVRDESNTVVKTWNGLRPDKLLELRREIEAA